MSITQYWRFLLGVTLALIVILFPRGVMGVAQDLWSKLKSRQ
jgi:ABC-type branched-subunit amino acid transport system permease subunit